MNWPSHTSGIGGPKNNFPVLVALDGKGNVFSTTPSTHMVVKNYVGDQFRKQTAVFNTDPTYQPYDPQGIALDAKGTLWMADHANEQVAMVGFLSNHLHAIILGKPGQPFHPRRIAIDDLGDIWLTGDEGVMMVRHMAAPVKTPLLGQPKAP